MRACWIVFHGGYLLSLLLLFLSCSSGEEVVIGDIQLQTGKEVVTVDVHIANKLLQSGHKYLDVRTEEEFKEGHVENAINIPYMFNTPEGRVKNPKFMEQVLSCCSKEDHLVVGCRSGIRSLDATADLVKAEFKHVCDMGGGYIAWVENGFAVKQPKVEL